MTLCDALGTNLYQLCNLIPQDDEWVRRFLQGRGLVAVYTARLETTNESNHKIWDVDIVNKVLGSIYTNVYVKQTALFSGHLTEGLKPCLGDYPQNQFKPELHQLKRQSEATRQESSTQVLEEDDPTHSTGVGRLLLKVHMSVLEKYHSNDGTYEDLYEAYSRSLRDWVSESGTDAERERNVVMGTWVSLLRDLARNGDGNRDLRGRKNLGYTVRCLISCQI